MQGTVSGVDCTSKGGVEGVTARISHRFELSLRRQQIECERRIHSVIDHYERELSKCTCASSVRRREVHKRTHNKLERVMQRFIASEKLRAASLAYLDVEIESHLQQLGA